MRCGWPLLNLLTDDALSNKDTVLVQQHLGDCVECQWEWNEISWLRQRLSNFREQLQPSQDFRLRLEQALDKEGSPWFPGNLPSQVLRYAAAIVIIISSTVLVPMTYKHNDSYFVATPTRLIDGLNDPAGLHAVSDRNQLVQQSPYNLEFINLPGWRLTKVGLYSMAGAGPIARLDFSRPYPYYPQYDNGQHHACAGLKPIAVHTVSCYQAPAGTISAKAGKERIFGSKKTRIGHYGQYHWALWSQNGMDYLLVTQMSESQID